MRLEISNVWARVVEATEPENEWLLAHLSCEDDRYESPKAKRRRPSFMQDDARVYCMLDRIGNVFPTGLLHNMRGAAKAAGVAVEIDDQRDVVCAINLDRSHVAWLRDYQWDAVKRCIRRGRGLIDAPTGSGKTEIFIALTRLLDCEWLFVVHRGDLVRQTAKRYQERTGEWAGTFEKGVWTRGSCNVTVATFQAIYRAMTKKPAKGQVIPAGGGVRDLLEGVEGLFVDETHAQPADSYYIVSMALERAYYRFGASATCLDRSDRENMRTMAATGPFAYRISHQTLVAQGILARSKVRMIECEQWGELDWTWSTVYKSMVTLSRQRNQIVTAMVKAAVKPCLCFVNHTRHGRALLEIIQQSGLSVSFVYGDKYSLASRRQKLLELERANVDVLLCTVIFQEGVDIPSLKSVVNAAGGDSTVACIQRRGRGTRRTEEAGGDVFELWDVLDLGQKWLERHAETRKAAYESRGDTVHIGFPTDMPKPVPMPRPTYDSIKEIIRKSVRKA